MAVTDQRHDPPHLGQDLMMGQARDSLVELGYRCLEVGLGSLVEGVAVFGRQLVCQIGEVLLPLLGR